jgi:hypothetical protein
MRSSTLSKRAVSVDVGMVYFLLTLAVERMHTDFYMFPSNSEKDIEEQAAIN